MSPRLSQEERWDGLSGPTRRGKGGRARRGCGEEEESREAATGDVTRVAETSCYEYSNGLQPNSNGLHLVASYFVCMGLIMG